MGSGENHFNVSLVVRDRVTRQCRLQTTTFEEKGEPKRIRTEGPSAYQPNALLLGQTGSFLTPSSHTQSLWGRTAQTNSHVATECAPDSSSVSPAHCGLPGKEKSTDEPKEDGQTTASSVSRFGLTVRRYAGKQKDHGSNPLRLLLSLQKCLWTLSWDYVPHN